MKHPLLTLVPALLLTPLHAAAPPPQQTDGLAQLARDFGTLPLDARRLMGPLFWLHGDETKERLELEADKVAEGGNAPRIFFR
jgi:hypothetical protein